MKLARILICMAVPALAGEATVERADFRVERRFKARVMPTEVAALELKPEAWATFTIKALKPHGARVAEGETVISFRREGYDRKVEDAQRRVRELELALGDWESSLARLEREQALELESVERALREAGDDLAYFDETGRQAALTDAAQGVDQAQFYLAAEKEELEQLVQMYEADDLTEATEEIILERQKKAIEWAEQGAKDAQRRAKEVEETDLPRRRLGLEKAVAQAELARDRAVADQPRAKAKAELALEGAKAALAREREDLAELEADAKWLEWKAPVAGVLYHGALEDGMWTLGDLEKQLVEGGSPPVRRAILSIVPEEAGRCLEAVLEPELARVLSVGAMAAVTIPGRPDLELRTELSEIAAVPNGEGKHLAKWSIEWPENVPVATTAEVEMTAMIYEATDAVVVTAKALHRAKDGSHEVEVKLAEGETELRPVKQGHRDGEQVEIREGLEAGQVIVIPD